jgi:hypothetical protein
VRLSRRQVDDGARWGFVLLQVLVQMLAKQREQLLHLVALRARGASIPPILDPVERAVNQFDDRDSQGTGRQRECDGCDVQSPDHDLTHEVRSSARSNSAVTVTAPEMASASRMAGIVSASIMGRVPSVPIEFGIWEACDGVGQGRARVNQFSPEAALKTVGDRDGAEWMEN